MNNNLRFSAVVALLATGGALAQEPEPPQPIQFGLTYTADYIGVIDGGLEQRGDYLDNLDVLIDADLDALMGWGGGTLHLHVLNNAGGTPNDFAGTLQGIDNIEVGEQRLRLFEAWIEQALGESATLRLGLYDLNSEFYANDAAGLLIGPSFGIGSELAATGLNGPSIFPSTALSARLNVTFGEDGFVRLAVLNADARVPGDPGGADTSFDAGVLMIAEGGIEGARKLSLGLWRYSKDQDDIREVDGFGDPVGRTAQGLYVTWEEDLNDPEGPQAVRAFVRAGFSDGDTTPFAGGWQAGFLMTRVFESRPDSQLSFGVSHAILSDGYVDNQIDAGVPISRGEFQIELTYSDTLIDGITVQPDLQWISQPGGDRSIPDALVAGLRVTVEL